METLYIFWRGTVYKIIIIIRGEKLARTSAKRFTKKLLFRVNCITIITTIDRFSKFRKVRLLSTHQRKKNCICLKNIHPYYASSNSYRIREENESNVFRVD